LCNSMFRVLVLIMWPSCWSASGLGELRNNFDASLTYEGDNNVLIQQTSNWLLRQWNKIREGEGVASPYNTVDFLSNATEILKKKFKGRDLQDVANHSCKYKQICLSLSCALWQTNLYLLISNCRCVLIVVFFLLGDSPASAFYVPMFQNTVCSIFIGGVSWHRLWRWEYNGRAH